MKERFRYFIAGCLLTLGAIAYFERYHIVYDGGHVYWHENSRLIKEYKETHPGSK